MQRAFVAISWVVALMLIIDAAMPLSRLLDYFLLYYCASSPFSFASMLSWCCRCFHAICHDFAITFSMLDASLPPILCWLIISSDVFRRFRIDIHILPFSFAVWELFYDFCLLPFSLMLSDYISFFFFRFRSFYFDYLSSLSCHYYADFFMAFHYALIISFILFYYITLIDCFHFHAIDTLLSLFIYWWLTLRRAMPPFSFILFYALFIDIDYYDGLCRFDAIIYYFAYFHFHAFFFAYFIISFIYFSSDFRFHFLYFFAALFDTLSFADWFLLIIFYFLMPMLLILFHFRFILFTFSFLLFSLGHYYSDIISHYLIILIFYLFWFRLLFFITIIESFDFSLFRLPDASFISLISAPPSIRFIAYFHFFFIFAIISMMPFHCTIFFSRLFHASFFADLIIFISISLSFSPCWCWCFDDAFIISRAIYSFIYAILFLFDFDISCHFDTALFHFIDFIYLLMPFSDIIFIFAWLFHFRDDYVFISFIDWLYLYIILILIYFADAAFHFLDYIASFLLLIDAISFSLIDFIADYFMLMLYFLHIRCHADTHW